MWLFSLNWLLIIFKIKKAAAGSFATAFFLVVMLKSPIHAELYLNANEQTAVELATLDAKTELALQGKRVIKRVFVPNKMLNFVVV